MRSNIHAINTVLAWDSSQIELLYSGKNGAAAAVCTSPRLTAPVGSGHQLTAGWSLVGSYQIYRTWLGKVFLAQTPSSVVCMLIGELRPVNLFCC